MDAANVAKDWEGTKFIFKCTSFPVIEFTHDHPPPVAAGWGTVARVRRSSFLLSHLKAASLFLSQRLCVCVRALCHPIGQHQALYHRRRRTVNEEVMNVSYCAL